MSGLNLGLLVWNYKNILVKLIVYAPWFFFITWVYFKINGYSRKENDKHNLFGLSPVPARKLPCVLAKRKND